MSLSDHLDGVPFSDEIKAFVQHDAFAMPQVGCCLFVGSSTIAHWHDRLAEDFPTRNVLGRGFGGSTMADLLMVFDLIVAPHRPNTIVVYEGDNDLAGTDIDIVTAHFEEFLRRVDQLSPHPRVLLVNVKPSIARWELWPVLSEFNARLLAMSESRCRVHLADIAAPMLAQANQPDQPPPPHLFLEDGLHLSSAGYDIWAKVIGSALDEIDTALHCDSAPPTPLHGVWAQDRTP
jgi:lysophospholipase L1-like esterase